MRKEDLEKIEILKNEIRLLQNEIDHPAIVSDSVVGSMPQFPYIKQTIVINGVDVEQDDRLKKRLIRKLADLQDTLVEMEGWLDSVKDSQMRQILRLRYRNGLSWQQIAFEIGECDEQYPRRKHNKFIEKLTKMTK